MYVRGFTKFGIKVLWRLQFLEYLRTLSLKFQKARTKFEVVLTLPCWLSQLNWDSQQGRVRTTSILVRAFWNFKLKVLKYSRNCSFHNTLIPNLVKPLKYIYGCLYLWLFKYCRLNKALLERIFFKMNKIVYTFIRQTIFKAIFLCMQLEWGPGNFCKLYSFTSSWDMSWFFLTFPACF